jgi:hypothetical protein
MLRQIYVFAAVALFTAAAIAQQSPSTPQADMPGWTSTMNFDGSANSQERVLDLDSTVGYMFDQHWAADVGVPFSFVSSSPSSSTSSTPGKSSSGTSSLNSIGNVHTDVNFKTNGTVANYGSTLTLAAPTGSTAKGVSTGRAYIGWNNHLEHAFDRLTPFVEAGFANGVMDTRFFHRPYTTLGFMSQFTGGSSLDLGHDFSVGASLYGDLPSGQQKMFSKLVGKKSGVATGNGNHGRAYELAAETSGDSSLTRDNGGSAWIEFSPGKVFDFQVGFTRSVHLDLNTVSFNLGINLGKLLKQASGY